MTLGENIKRLRKKKRMTQGELAEEMKISRSYLGDLENNRRNPSASTLNKLSEKLNVPIEYLLNDGTGTDFNIEQIEDIEFINKLVKNMVKYSNKEEAELLTAAVAIFFETLDDTSENKKYLVAYSNILSNLSILFNDQLFKTPTISIKGKVIPGELMTKEMSISEYNKVVDRIEKEMKEVFDFRLSELH